MDADTQEQLSPEYLLLFNGISDTIEELQAMIDRLKFLQQRAEELFIEKVN